MFVVFLFGWIVFFFEFCLIFFDEEDVFFIVDSLCVCVDVVGKWWMVVVFWYVEGFFVICLVDEFFCSLLELIFVILNFCFFSFILSIIFLFLLICIVSILRFKSFWFLEIVKVWSLFVVFFGMGKFMVIGVLWWLFEGFFIFFIREKYCFLL